MKHRTYSHGHGDATVPDHLKQDVVTAITGIAVKPTKGATTKLRDAFLENLRAAGWSGEVPVSKESKMTITSTKEEVGLCLQTGNMGRMYADLLKLQAMHLNKSIKAAIVIVPSHPISRLLGDNIANARRLERELDIFKKAYSVPTLVFALE